MNETKYYEVIPFDGNGRVLDGFFVTKHSSLTVLIAWSENIIMIYDFNGLASRRRQSEVIKLFKRSSFLPSICFVVLKLSLFTFSTHHKCIWLMLICVLKPYALSIY